MTIPDPPPKSAEAVAWVRTVAEPVARRLAADDRARRLGSNERDISPKRAAGNTGGGSLLSRADAHSMLDALIDLADAATRFGTEVAASIVMTGRQAASMGTGPRSGWSPAFLLGRVAPGKAVSGTLDIANTGMEPFEGIQFRCNGLGGGGNDRIADSQIDISPRQLDVQSGWAVPVTVTVRVPATARLGGYTGVVEVVGWPELNALVSLEVV